MEHKNAIEFRNVSKRFGEVVANDRINLTLRQGEILSILGENGSGKTTLMNMLSGIYFPDEGHILVNGEANKGLKNADFDFIAVKPNNNPTGRDVLFCTRGLQKEGKWTGEDALYGTKGGLVAFRDGSVRFLSEHTGAAEHLAVWHD